MDGVRTCLLLFIVLTFATDFHQCGRYSGGRSRTGSGNRGGSYHTPSAPRYPSPSAPRPRPTSSPHYDPPVNRVTSRPLHQHPSSVRPHHESTAARGTSRPLGFDPPRVSTRRTMRPPTTPRRATTYRPRSSTASWNSLPPRPGSAPYGPYGNQGPNKIKIVNKYNYHYPGYYSLPVQHHSYPGYYYTPSTYHYGMSDTGSTVLGLYLGYSLAKLTTPTYSHYSFYDGYRPRYDHYTVHHYYHNKDSVPQNQEIRSNTIVGCVGDSATICPVNTTSLCTSSGALMCVVSATSTVPCTDNRQLNCVKSIVSCVNNTAPECKNSNQNSTSISIPCVSSAKIYGDLKYVNNTIIVANNTSPNVSNVTNVSNSSTAATEFSTQYPITTTPSPQPPPTNTSIRKKRDAPQNFCVTIVALPAEKQLTEGEETFNEAKKITLKFIESAWGL